MNQTDFLAEDEIKQMKQEEEDISKELDEQLEKEKKTMDYVKSIVSDAAYKQIETEISESGYTYNFRIIDKPLGIFQDSYDNLIKIWVKQSSNGDDSYYGTVCIQLNADKFLAFDYSFY